MAKMTLQEALAMFPADGSPPQMMDDRHGDVQHLQEALRIVAAAFRRLTAEHLLVLRDVRVLHASAVPGREYALVPAHRLNAMALNVANLYSPTARESHVQQSAA